MPLLRASIAIILSSDQTHVLLIKRRDVPVWVLPGGGVELNETFEEALTREILEETGYHVQILRKCAEYSPINGLSSPTAVFMCRIRSGNRSLNSEAAEIAFHPLSRLPSSFFSVHAGWTKEAMASEILIQRPLVETSYFKLLLYFFRHPWQVLRYALTRFLKN